MSNRDTELGTLIIVILKAKDLNDKHSFYKQDVFAQVSLNGETKRTSVAVKGGQRPEWDEEVRFPVMKDTLDKFRKLEVACFSKEHKTDDLLGKGEVDITDTLKNGEFDEWVPLNVNGVVRGDLYLEMTFFSNAPAPEHSHLAPPVQLQRHPSKLQPSERLSRPPQHRVASGSSQVVPLGHPQANPHPPPARQNYSPHQLNPHHQQSYPPLSNSSTTPYAHAAPGPSQIAPSRPSQADPHQPRRNFSPQQSGPHQPSYPLISNPAAQTAALRNLLSDGPHVAQQPPMNNTPHRVNHHLQASPASSRSSSSSRANSPLPPLPVDEAPLPHTLLAGGGRHPHHAPSTPPQVAPQLPSALQIGRGRAASQSHQPPQALAHERHSSTDSLGTGLRPSDYFAGPSTQASSPVTLQPHTLSTGNTPYMSGPTLAYKPPASPVHTTPTQPFYAAAPPAPTPAPVSAATPHWNPHAGPPSFPVPQTSYTPSAMQNDFARNTTAPSQASYYVPPQPGYPLRPSSSYQQPSNNYPDPYLQARYQTPLPLPPETGRQGPSVPATRHADSARIEALRQAEEEAARRKAQEDKDLALALALDRELNLEGEDEPTPTTARNHSVIRGY
ncbi:hypothetical protein H0H92_009412 [Tricholoma furcatifolium]|nr:hypothetical protein H0H92_009412 [Tricholoma furcatifolium]